MSLAGDFSPAASPDQQPCTGLEPLLDSKLRCALTSNSPALDSNWNWRSPPRLRTNCTRLRTQTPARLRTQTPARLRSTSNPDSSSTALDFEPRLQLDCARLRTPPGLHSELRLDCQLGVAVRPFMGYGGAFGLPPSTSHPPLAPPLLAF